MLFKGSKASGHTLYNGVSVSEKLGQKLTSFKTRGLQASSSTLVYGYYGHKGNGPAGHAVAYSDGNFFDPNTGVWTCSPLNSGGTYIDAYIPPRHTWTPEKSVIFILAYDAGTGIPSRTKNATCTII